MNAYDMILTIRDNIGEEVAALWTNASLIRMLNNAHRAVSTKVMNAPGDWLLTSTNLTPASGVITLPSDCAKPVYLEEKGNNRVIVVGQTVRERQLTRAPISGLSGLADRSAYFVGGTLVINDSTYSTQVTLWYQKRVIDLFAGVADASSGAQKIVFLAADSPRVIDDYYNDTTVEIVSGTGISIVDTISDYDGGTYSATITGTSASADTFGTVSTLPEEAMDLIVMRATLLSFMRPSASLNIDYFEHMKDLTALARNDLDEFLSSRYDNSRYVTVTDLGS